MNTQPSPLVPQGSLLEQKNRGRARVKIAVFFVLAVHGIGLMALLMQGCRREEPSAAQPTNDVGSASNPLPPMMDATNPPVVETNPPAAGTGTVATTSALPEAVQPPAAQTAVTEYKVAKGDNFTTIARKFRVSPKAIADANPGVDSSKLQIGQTLKIPAGTATATNGSATAGEPSTGGQTYKVKSGDTLSKIAGQFGVTVRAIENENGLKSTRITVGQVLKIPAKSGTSTNTATPTTTPAPTTPQP